MYTIIPASIVSPKYINVNNNTSHELVLNIEMYTIIPASIVSPKYSNVNNNTSQHN